MKALLAFGLVIAVITTTALAQDRLDLAGPPSGYYDNQGTPSVIAGEVVFTLRLTVARPGSCGITGMQNGFILYDAAGGNITPPAAAVIYPLGSPIYPFVSADGFGSDTVAFSYSYSGCNPLLVQGFSEDVYTITTGAPIGGILCIDTAWFPPAGTWIWSFPDGDVYPAWDGPYCYQVIEEPPAAPIFPVCPFVLMMFNHCAVAAFDFNAQQEQGLPITYTLVSGPGQVDPVSGLWTCQGSIGLVGPIHQGVVRASVEGAPPTDCMFEFAFTNMAPTITCKAPVICGVGVPFSTTITKNDVDCDTGTFSIAGITPTPVGAYSIHPSTGVLTFTPDQQDDLLSFDFEIMYSDGHLMATCVQQISALDLFACCNFRGDIDGSGTGPNVSDLTMFVNVFFKGMGPFLCDAEADVNNDYQRNVSDLTYLVDFLFRGGPAPVPCP